MYDDNCVMNNDDFPENAEATNDEDNSCYLSEIKNKKLKL